MTDLASASVRIEPDLSRFEEELKAGLERATGGEGGKVPIGLDVDDAEAKAKLDAIDAKADETGAKRETIKVNVDTDGADTAIKKLGQDAAAAGGSDGLGALALALIGLSPLISPLAAAASGAVLGLGGAFAAAGAGLGAFALAASGDLDNLKTEIGGIFDNWRNQFTSEILPVLNQVPGLVSTALGDIEPLVQGGISGVTRVIDELRTALDSPQFMTFTLWLGGQIPAAMSSLSRAFGDFAAGFGTMLEKSGPLITEMENGLVSLASDFDGLAHSQGFQSFVAYAQQELPQVGKLLDNVATSVGHILTALEPVGAGMLSAFSGITGVLSDIVGFSPGLDQIGLAIAGLAFGFSKLSGPVGDAVKGVKDFNTAVENAGTAQAAKGLKGTLADLVAGFGDDLPAALGVAGIAAGALVGGYFALNAISGSLKNSTDDVTAATRRWIEAAITLPTQTLPEMQSAVEQSRAKLSGLEAQFRSLTNAYVNYTDATPTKTVNENAVATDQLTAKIDSLQRYVKGLSADEKTWVSNEKEVAEALGISKANVDSLANSLGINLSKALKPDQVAQMGEALNQMAAISDTTTVKMEKLASEAGVSISTLQGALTDTANTATKNFNTATDAVTHFSGQMSVTAAQVKEYYSQQALAAAQFNTNLAKAVEEHYPAQLVEQIAEQGPAAAGFLQALVSDNSGALENLVAGATSSLATSQAAAVGNAKIMRFALQANNTGLNSDLAEALALNTAIAGGGGKSMSQAYAQALVAQFPNVAQIAGEFPLTLPKAITDALAGTSAAGNQQVQKYLDALNAAKPKAGSAGDDAVGTYLAALASDKAQAMAAAAGSSNVGSFAGGITAAQQKAADAGDKTADAATKSAAAHDAKPAGQALVKGMVDGISTQQPGLNTAALTAIKDAIDYAKPLTGGQSLGKALDDGIIDGINKGVPGIENAAISAAKAALKAATGPSGINSGSPSRAAAELIGIPFAQGISAGIMSSLGIVEGAAKSAANALLGAGSTGTIGGLSGLPLSAAGTGRSVTVGAPTFNVNVNVPGGSSSSATDIASTVQAQMTPMFTRLLTLIEANK